MKAPFRVDVVSLFPEFFGGPLETGLVGRAFREGRAEFGVVDPRDFTSDRHRSVDGSPYGGGAGMVMRVEPVVAALQTVRSRGTGPVLLMSPRGRPLRQADLRRYAEGTHLGLVCGRYEGLDERIADFVDEEVSLGDFVLTGGEYAALAIIDGVIRLQPGTLGNPASASSDSFENGWLEHPHYTRPERFRDRGVPELLQSGHHERVDRWRRRRQIEVTAQRRPELLSGLRLEGPDREGLSFPSRDLRLAVAPEEGELAALAALGAAYGVPIYAVGVDAEAAASLPDPEVPAWPRPRKHRIRTVPVRHSMVVSAVPSWAALRAELERDEVAAFGVDARWPDPERTSVAPSTLLEHARAGAVCLALGAPEDWGLGCLPGLRQATEAQCLSLATRASVLLDRILGEV